MDGFYALFGGSQQQHHKQQQAGNSAEAPSSTPTSPPSTCPVVGASASTPSPAASSAAIAAAAQQQRQQDQQHAARINMPVVPNDASALDPKVARLLSTQRAASTIPMSADAAAAPPRHQQPPQQAQQPPGPGEKRKGWGAWLSGPWAGDKRASSAPAPQQQPQLPNPQADAVWMYPSEAQFFAAMRRKGWDPRPEDMANVVRIHNAVNERAWMHVLEWEERRRRQGGAAAAGAGGDDAAARLCACCGRAECGGANEEVRLKRFVGRPADLSPKARMLNLFGYKLPFDRHDWVVERCCVVGAGGGGDANGSDADADAAERQRRRCVEARYVIDFYSGRSLIPGVPAVHLDVRPAIDSPSAAWQRATALGAALADAAAAGLGLSPRPPARPSAAGRAGATEQVQRILDQQQQQHQGGLVEGRHV